MCVSCLQRSLNDPWDKNLERDHMTTMDDIMTTFTTEVTNSRIQYICQ